MEYVIRKLRGREESAYCRNCHWSEFTSGCLRKAKAHVARTGHAVEVYYEVGRVVKPETQKKGKHHGTSKIHM